MITIAEHLQTIDNLISAPTAASSFEMHETLEKIARLQPRIHHILHIRTPDLTYLGIEQLVRSIREKKPDFNLTLCASKVEWEERLRAIHAEGAPFRGSFVIKGNSILDMQADRDHEATKKNFRELFLKGKIDEEAYRSVHVDYHMVHAYVEMNLDSCNIYLMDAVKFNESSTARNLSFFLANLAHTIPNMQLYILPESRQYSQHWCGVFALRDAIECYKHPEIIEDMRSDAKPDQTFWDHHGYNFLIETPAQVRAEQLADDAELEEILVDTPLVKPIKEQLKAHAERRRARVQPLFTAIISKITVYRIVRAAPALMKYTQSVSTLRLYEEINSSKMNLCKFSVSIRKHHFLVRLIKGDSEQNHKIAHHFRKYVRLLLSEL